MFDCLCMPPENYMLNASIDAKFSDIFYVILLWSD